jgi:hypothetical protein
VKVTPKSPVEESTVATSTDSPSKRISTEPLSTGQVPLADTPSPAYPLVGSSRSVGSTGGTTTGGSTSNESEPPQLVVTS